jgi:hypothetical protein
MARVSTNYLKTRFESGDRPTQQDFLDLIDTLIEQSTDLGTAGNNERERVITGIEQSSVIDSFSATEWRMVKYFISMSIAPANKFYVTELTILNDGTNVSVSEYGIVENNNGEVGTVEVEQNGGNIQLIAVPASGLTNPVTVRFGRIGLKI